MTTDVTPPLCCHCGQPMHFVAVHRSLHTLDVDGWDESWRCPEGRWSLLRTVPAPFGYQRAPARRARRKKPR